MGVYDLEGVRWGEASVEEKHDFYRVRRNDLKGYKIQEKNHGYWDNAGSKSRNSFQWQKYYRLREVKK